MDRRTLLKYLAATPLLSRLPVDAFALASPALKAVIRRVRFNDPAWPSPAMWDKLKQQVGGRLIAVQSPLPSYASAIKKGVSESLLQDLHNPFYLGDQPGITETFGWVDAWTTAPSIYAVAASSAEDVAAAVNFAREKNLRLVVKGGGHSYQGTSCAPDSLLVWTRHMNDIVLQQDFVPRGCAGRIAPQPAVTLGAGVIGIHAYDAVTTKAGQYVQGGGCTTVGLAGLVQSGGFGSFSKHYGTAASGLLEAEVITADGKIRTANACNEPDLFWALKGGGGGSFGVISKLTLRLRELPEWFGAAIFTIKASSDDAYRRLLRQFVGFYSEQLFNDHWGEQVHVRGDNVLEIRFVSHGLDTAQSKSIWQPFLDWLAHSPSDYELVGPPPIIVGVPARHWWDVAFMNQGGRNVFTIDPRPGAGASDAWWQGDGDQAGQVLYGYQSLWLPASLLKADAQDGLANALFAASRRWQVGIALQQGSRRRAGRSDRRCTRHGHESRRLRCLRAGHHRVRNEPCDSGCARA